MSSNRCNSVDATERGCSCKREEERLCILGCDELDPIIVQTSKLLRPGDSRSEDLAGDGCGDMMLGEVGVGLTRAIGESELLFSLAGLDRGEVSVPTRSVSCNGEDAIDVDTPLVLVKFEAATVVRLENICVSDVEAFSDVVGRMFVFTSAAW